MKKATFVLSLALALVMALGVTAYALSENVVITAVVPNVFTLSVTDPAVDFGLLTANEVEFGKTIAAANTVAVKSNKIYTLSDQMLADFSDGGTLSMPASALTYTWTGDGTGSATGSTASQTITATGARGNTAYDFDYTLTPTLNADEANYTATVTYTALQN